MADPTWKKSLKRIIPKKLLQIVVNPYHLLEAIVASALNGFPARKMKFIGVTGTNGKTTTVNLIGSILETAGYSVGINSTAVLQVGEERWENDIQLTTGNPFDIQKLLKRMRKAKVEWVVMEVSSHALIQHRVWGIKFHATVMTNLTQDHLDYHHNMEEYAAAKGKLFRKYPRVMVLNRDDKWFDFYDRYEAEQQISYGTSPKADARIVSAKLGMRGSRLAIRIDNHDFNVELKLPGKFNAYNALAAATTAYALGVSLNHIKEGLESLEAVPGRMEVIDEGQDFTVIIDYAHTPDALNNVLKTIRTTLKGRLISVVGADGDRDSTKREETGKIAAGNSEVVIITDQEPYSEDPAPIRTAVKKGAEAIKFGTLIYEVADREEAFKKAFSYAKKGDVVLLSGVGSQNYRGTAEGKTPWDERGLARKLLSSH